MRRAHEKVRKVSKTAGPLAVQPNLDLPNNAIAKVEITSYLNLKTKALQNYYLLLRGDVTALLSRLPKRPLFDLVISSPPYNIGKSYETKKELKDYLKWQKAVIAEIVPRLKQTGSLCWQVGNFIDDGHILPLDIEFDPIFRKQGLQLRNRIVWHFGHGLHSRRRFSGRYEVVLWYTKSDKYVFNLDDVRVPAKYPGKRHFKGPKAGQLSGNPRGKNPEDVWEFPANDLLGFENSLWS